MKKQIAYLRVSNPDSDDKYLIAEKSVELTSEKLILTILDEPIRLKETEAYIFADTDLELLKAGLEPLEPFTPEFLSMMLTLGISRLTEAQRYALADGLLERLPERPNYWKQRCLLAEKCMEESPSDPDITTAQIEAHKEYNEFLSNQKNPVGE